MKQNIIVHLSGCGTEFAIGDSVAEQAPVEPKNISIFLPRISLRWSRNRVSLFLVPPNRWVGTPQGAGLLVTSDCGCPPQGPSGDTQQTPDAI